MGDWTHMYAEPGNSTYGGDQHVGGDMELLWFGRPGPRDMLSGGGRQIRIDIDHTTRLRRRASRHPIIECVRLNRYPPRRAASHKHAGRSSGQRRS